MDMRTFQAWKKFGVHFGDGLRLGISAAVFAHFNLDAPSLDLINPDYIVGFLRPAVRFGGGGRAPTT